MASILTKIDAPTYLLIRKVMCPYCGVGLPDTRDNATPPTWMHIIPNSPSKFNCTAERLRQIRFADGAPDA